MFEFVLLRWLCITIAWQGESVCVFECVRVRVCLTDFPDIEQSHIALGPINIYNHMYLYTQEVLLERQAR